MNAKRMKNIVSTVCLMSVVPCMSIGCIEMHLDNVSQDINNTIPEANKVFVPEVITKPTELDRLVQFLDADKTDEIIYYEDIHRGIDYFVCCGYARALAKNASEYNITMGGISIRDHEHVRASKHYHAMNYVIVDDSFVIIEPQSDDIFYLDTIQYHHGGVYRYITIHPNAQIVTNFGKSKQTIDINLANYNETGLVERWQ